MHQHTINIEQHFNQISNIPDRNQNRGLRWSLKIFFFLNGNIKCIERPRSDIKTNT